MKFLGTFDAPDNMILLKMIGYYCCDISTSQMFTEEIFPLAVVPKSWDRTGFFTDIK